MTDQARNTQLQLCISSEDKALIQQAADATGLDVSAFVLLHTKKAAEEVVAGRRVFALADDEYAEFLARLDEPAKVLPGLQDLVAKPSPFSAAETVVIPRDQFEALLSMVEDRAIAQLVADRLAAGGGRPFSELPNELGMPDATTSTAPHPLD